MSYLIKAAIIRSFFAILCWIIMKILKIKFLLCYLRKVWYCFVFTILSSIWAKFTTTFLAFRTMTSFREMLVFTRFVLSHPSYTVFNFVILSISISISLIVLNTLPLSKNLLYSKSVNRWHLYFRFMFNP